MYLFLLKYVIAFDTDLIHIIKYRKITNNYVFLFNLSSVTLNKRKS